MTSIIMYIIDKLHAESFQSIMLDIDRFFDLLQTLCRATAYFTSSLICKV